MAEEKKEKEKEKEKEKLPLGPLLIRLTAEEPPSLPFPSLPRRAISYTLVDFYCILFSIAKTSSVARVLTPDELCWGR